MKIFTKLLFLTVALCCWGVVGYGQTTLLLEDFEDGTITYTSNITEVTDGSGDYWIRTDGSNINASFTDIQGSSFFGAQDTDEDPGNSVGVLTFSGINISGFTGLEFSFFVAEDDDGSAQDWDANTQLKIEYSIDGGASTEIFRIEAAGSTNTEPRVDTNFDGIGDGTAITDAFQQFSESIAGTGTSLELVITISNLDAGDEDIALDEVMVTGITSSTDPEPTNHPTNFISDTGTPPTSVIEMVWDDATGAQLPAGYVIKANTTGTFSDPVDGTDPTEDTDLSDGTALVKVTQGTEFYSFSGLNASTQYYFKIWPYTNAGANIDFKTDGTPLEDDTTTEAECGITNLGSASISCDSNTSGDDNDFVTISLDYTGVDAGAVLAILAGGSSESNTGDDPTADTDGTISFAALEGDAWSVTITGGNCNLSQSGTVLSSECDPAPMIPIIISRVADPGDNANGRFVEIKNVSASSQDISDWELKRYANSNTTPQVNVIDNGAILAPGETYIIGASNFSSAFGCDANETNGSVVTGNGDDTYALFDDIDVLIDIYGEIGQDGTGEAWEYEDAIAVRSAGVTAASTIWISSEWTITSADIADIDVCPIVPAPDNDECENATVIGCGDSLTGETTAGATDNGDATGCTYGKGVWYSFEGTDQNVTVTADDDNFDLGISISSSEDCMSFSNIDCVDAEFAGTPEQTTFYANSGTTYYIYIAYFGNTSNIVGDFDISVTCTDVDIASGTDGICDAVNNITSTGSGAWLNIVDGSGDLVASVLDSENLGLLQTSIYINAGDVRQDGNNLPYLDRNISIEPATQPSGTIKVRWYLTTAEFDALAAADSDVSSISDLNITKFDGGCSDEFNGAGTVVQQSASGSLNAGYFVEVDVTSFSNFFLHADLVALPVELTSFTAKAINNQTHLSFTTAIEENNSHFLVQRSTDEGKTFETIGQVDGKGNSNSAVDYQFVDTKPAAGMNYYRLQQFDYDGTNEFFGPVAVRFSGEVADAPVIWPVPARDRLQIQLPASDSDWQLEVFDLNGRRLLQKTTEEKGINTFFDLNTLPAGSYFLRWSNGSQSGQERFLKV